MEEIHGLHHELDEEIARLSNLGEMAPAMANVLRHLHTIKGSSMMAEANALGELTHQTETFLETNFIRNEDDLREVRKTLELYVDALDHAADSYGQGASFTAPADLLAKLGVDTSAPAPAAPEPVAEKPAVEKPVAEEPVVIPAAPEPEVAEEPELSSFDINEELAEVSSQMTVHQCRLEVSTRLEQDSTTDARAIHRLAEPA